MRMGVDQPGQHDFVRDIDDLSGTCRQDIGLNGGNFAIADGDILQAIDARGRIDDAPPTQQQIKCGAHGHGCSPILCLVLCPGAGALAGELRSMLRIFL
jgi:hypothetical protein